MKNKLFPAMHYLITAIVVFGFRLLPPIGEITPYGMGILGTFVGAIYGWTTINLLWPSFVALIGLGFVVGMPQMIASSFGNPVVAAMFAVFPMMAVLNDLKVTEHLSNKFLSNRLSAGRPWVAIFLLFLGAYICAPINSALVVIIFAAFIMDLCKKLNIAPYSKLPTALMLGLAYAIMNGQIIFPFFGTGLTFTAAYQSMFHESLPYDKFMLFIIPLGLVLIVIYLLIMRFVFRVDVSPLADLNEEMLGCNKKMTRDQKRAGGFFLLFVFIMIASSLLPGGWAITKFLNGLTLFGISAIIVCIMMVIKRVDGTPLLDFDLMSSTGLIWSPVLVTAYVMAVSPLLTAPEAGLSTTLNDVLAPMTQFSPLVFIILAMFFAAVLTNIASNLILTVIIMPILGTFALQIGLNPAGLTLLLFMTTQMALICPGASPITAIVFSQCKLVKTGDLMKHSLIAVPILFVFCMVLGLMYINAIF